MSPLSACNWLSPSAPSIHTIGFERPSVVVTMADPAPRNNAHQAVVMAGGFPARIFKAMRPLDPSNIVRGQYRGYRQEDGVTPDSQVETFAAVRIYLDCWRWADVPFYIRAGKKLPVTTTEILVELQDPPQAVFGGEQPVESNHYRFRLSPDVMISIGAHQGARRDDARRSSSTGRASPPR